MARSLAAWWNDRSLLGKGIAVLAVPLAILIGITTLFLFAAVAADRSAGEFVRASRVSKATVAIQQGLASAEAGVRGYLVTGEQRFLHPYDQAIDDLPQARRDLATALATEPEVAGLVQRFDALIEARLVLWRELIASAQMDASDRFLLLAAGEETMEEVSGLIQDVERIEDEKIRSANADRTASAALAKSAAWLGIAVGAAAALLASIVFTRSITRRVQRNRENAELLLRGLPLKPPPEGDDEVGRSGAALVEAARQIQEVERDLHRSNEELERFAYVASHDLQEPLRMVASHVQLLAADLQGTLGPDQEESIAFAVDGAKRMQRLINDLLTYSRVGRRGKPPEPTPMADVLETALVNLQVAIGEQEAAVTSDELPVLEVDGGQMVQLLQNLIGNAIKFRGERPPRVHVRAEAGEGEWILSVEDNGIGIPPEHAERVFQIFQRLHTRAEYDGTGIGLAVCRRIIERHGGRIWIESTPGEGSRVRFTIPSAPADLAA